MADEAGRTREGTAYAVLDARGLLTLIRSEDPRRLENGQAVARISEGR